MKILCGLGNPGRDYARHRHNVGFQVVDRLWSRSGASAPRSKFDAKVGEGALGGVRVLLLEPQTFMNLSGKALAPAVRFYKVDLSDVLVIHDELDLPFGRLQLKRGGGTGGHNGLGSIRDHLGTADFARLRVGIGKPSGPDAKERVIGHVLSSFGSDEEGKLDALFSDAVDAAEVWVTDGLETAMNRFNRRSDP